MSKTFSDLGPEVQNKILENFNRYKIDGEHMFNETTFFSDEMKDLSDENFLEMFDMKQISHIYPQSKYPELIDEPCNVFLEDSFENLSRGSSIVTTDEINAAYYDQIQDTLDFDIDDNGIIDLNNFESDFDSFFDFESWDIDILDYLFS